MENKLGKQVVNCNDQSGIKVYPVPENYLYVVEAPNSYDVYWPITGKMADRESPLGYKVKPQDIVDTQTPWINEQIMNGELQESDRYSFGLMNLLKFDEDGKPTFKNEKSVHIVIELDKLSSNEEINSFNQTVLQARKFNDERTSELNRFEFKNGKEGELSDKVKGLLPEDAFAPEYKTQVSKKFGKPANNWVAGKVLEAGKFYTMVYTGTSSREVEAQGLVKTHHIHIVNTSDILDGSDWQLKNREKAIRELCPENEFKSFNWSPNSKIRVSDYDPQKALENKAKKIQAQEKYNAEIDTTKPKAPAPIVEKEFKAEEVKKIEEPAKEEAPEVNEKKKSPAKSKVKEKAVEMAR